MHRNAAKQQRPDGAKRLSAKPSLPQRPGCSLWFFRPNSPNYHSYLLCKSPPGYHSFPLTSEKRHANPRNKGKEQERQQKIGNHRHGFGCNLHHGDVGQELATNKLTPIGGVTKPMARFTTIIIPKWTGCTPRPPQSGAGLASGSG